MTFRVILKNGAEFVTKCESYRRTKNGFGQIVGIAFESITENQPVYWNLDDVAAVVRLLSDEGGDCNGIHAGTASEDDG